jgi:hypothetical protein
MKFRLIAAAFSPFSACGETIERVTIGFQIEMDFGDKNVSPLKVE